MSSANNRKPWFRIKKTYAISMVLATSFTICAYGYLHFGKQELPQLTFEPQMQLQPVDNDIKPADSNMDAHDPIVLCYHQVRKWESRDSKNARTYIVPVDSFHNQMKLLYDRGYRTVLPDKLDIPSARIPGKSFILTFDDGTESQYINALPELDRYGFKAVFFIMTVTVDKPNFMSRKQIRYLSDNGHLIGCHTWDHHDVRNYKEDDWVIQLKAPTLLLEQITNKSVHYFAYPFGLWDTAAIRQLKSEGYVAAYQLSGRKDKNNPAFTQNRKIVDGHWPQFRYLQELSLSSKNLR